MCVPIQIGHTNKQQNTITLLKLWGHFCPSSRGIRGKVIFFRGSFAPRVFPTLGSRNHQVPCRLLAPSPLTSPCIPNFIPTISHKIAWKRSCDLNTEFKKNTSCIISCPEKPSCHSHHLKTDKTQTIPK